MDCFETRVLVLAEANRGRRRSSNRQIVLVVAVLRNIGEGDSTAATLLVGDHHIPSQTQLLKQQANRPTGEVPATTSTRRCNTLRRSGNVGRFSRLSRLDTGHKSEWYGQIVEALNSV